MDDLIIRALQGRAGPDEEDLSRWRRQSEANERRYRALARLWSVTEVAKPDFEVETAPDPETLISEVARAGEKKSAPELRPAPKLEPLPMVSRTRRSRAPVWRALKVAALAALFVPVGLGIGALLDTGAPAALDVTEITTGSGEMTTVTLGDGSSIRVGPRSRLRLSWEGSNQVGWLDGRAFFGIQADPSRTFTVRTPHGEAAVLGTRFEVRSEDEEFRVLVVDGSVKVSAAEVEAELRGGEMSESRPGQPPSTSMVDDVHAQLDWMGNALVFQATPFRRALDEVERAYGVDVILERPALGDLAVTATFTDQEVDEVILILCEIVGVDCSMENGLVRVGSGERPAESSSGGPRQ